VTASDGWEGRSCVITGARGFIGTALTQRLRLAGASVHAFAHVSDGDFTSCDVTDLNQVRARLRRARPTVVFHLAGRVTGSRELDLVVPTLMTNFMGTINVLLASQELGCPRVLCLGSLQEPDQAIPAIPPSPYAASKFAAGAYVRMFTELYSLSATIARPYMVYGPGQMDFTKLVPYVLERLLSGQVAQLSSGTQEFDWVYVEDVVDSLLAVAASDRVVGKTIDIGTGVLTSVADIARGIARLTGSSKGLRLGVIPDRRLEPTRVADVEATTRLTGWRAKVGVAEGLDRTVEWYRYYFNNKQ
jgi:UDP-glucose 4-epimerase